MKMICLVLVYVLVWPNATKDNKMSMVCQKWKQIGFKSFGKEYKPVDESLAEVLSFNENGTYTEELYGNLHINGQWKFATDSLKLAFLATEMNGTVMNGGGLSDVKPTDSILRLTNDTLIYGTLAYYGKEKIYGHDDSYFVRVK